MDLGFQVDPVASTTSALIMIGCVWGYINMINFSKMRQKRDNEAQLLRNAKVLVLAGKLDADTYERAVADAKRAAQQYEAAKRVRIARVPMGGLFAEQPPRRQLRARASMSGLETSQPGKQDDPEQVLQDFKGHLLKLGLPTAVQPPRQPREPRARPRPSTRRPGQPSEQDIPEEDLHEWDI
jgi:hypothetical protein